MDSPDAAKEMKKNTPRSLTVASTFVDSSLPGPTLPLDKISDYGRLVKITEVILRFLPKQAESAQRVATTKLVLHEQLRYYPTEMKKLQAQEDLPASSTLRKLHPVLGSDGTMRLGGRLTHADIDEDAARPLLIPPKSPLVKLILRHIHQRMYHAGAGICCVEFRKMFWTSGLKSKIRHVIHDCVKCARFNSRPIIPLMGDLPAPRVKPSAPFTHTHRFGLRGPVPCESLGTEEEEEAGRPGGRGRRL